MTMHFAHLMLFCALYPSLVWLAAYGCDFDTVTGEGCSGWSTPDSSDGIQGFATASGRDFQERGNPAELGHFPGKDANGKEQGKRK